MGFGGVGVVSRLRILRARSWFLVVILRRAWRGRRRRGVLGGLGGSGLLAGKEFRTRFNDDFRHLCRDPMIHPEPVIEAWRFQSPGLGMRTDRSGRGVKVARDQFLWLFP